MSCFDISFVKYLESFSDLIFNKPQFLCKILQDVHLVNGLIEIDDESDEETINHFVH